MKKVIVILLTLLSVMAAGLTAFAASTGNLQVPQGNSVSAARATALICRNQAVTATAARNIISAGNVVSSAAAYCPNNNICITEHVRAYPAPSASQATRSYSSGSSYVSQPATSYVSQPTTTYVTQPSYGYGYHHSEGYGHGGGHH